MTKHTTPAATPAAASPRKTLKQIQRERYLAAAAAVKEAAKLKLKADLAAIKDKQKESNATSKYFAKQLASLIAEQSLQIDFTVDQLQRKDFTPIEASITEFIDSFVAQQGNVESVDDTATDTITAPQTAPQTSRAKSVKVKRPRQKRIAKAAAVDTEATTT